MITPECTNTYQLLLLEHRSLQLLSYIIFSSSNSVPVPYNLLGLLIIGLGVYLVLQSVLLLRSYNTTLEPGGNPSSLVTKYPYNHSRNPVYLGDLLIALGSATALASVSAFIAPIIFFLVVNTIVIPFEENRLQKNFGIEYQRYRGSVRRWL